MKESKREKLKISDLTYMDSLSSYLVEVRKYPILSQDEEYSLAKQWREKGDAKAIERIIKSHLRLIPKIAAGYKGYGLPIEDLIAEGHIGLMQAVRKYEPDKGARFSTYSTWWIKASMKEYIMRSWSLVKIGTTVGQKKLFFKLRSLKDKLSKEGKSLTPDQVTHLAKEFQVNPREVSEMEKRLSGPDYSLNAGISSEDGGEWQDWLADESVDNEEKVIHEEDHRKKMLLLNKAFGKLSDKELTVLKSRRLTDPPKTLEEIGLDLNLSRERVRQIEMQAFTKLQKGMRSIAHEQEMAH
jgi:RNA polymerase sigma-32 factor